MPTEECCVLQESRKTLRNNMHSYSETSNWHGNSKRVMYYDVTWGSVRATIIVREKQRVFTYCECNLRYSMRHIV